MGRISSFFTAKNLKKVGLNFLFTIAFPVIVYLIMELLTYSIKGLHIFTSIIDFKNLIRDSGIACLLAFALSFNLSCGRFDLSLGAQRLAGTIIGGYIAIHLLGLDGIALLFFSIIFGFIFGLLTGLLFVTLRVPPMVLGIGVGLILEVIPYVVTGGTGLDLTSKQTEISILNNTWFILAVVFISAIVVSILLLKTKYGYDARSIQGSQLIARNSGVKVFRNAVIAYSLAGLFVCVAGVLSLSNQPTMNASLGLTSNSVVTANMFVMILGGYIGRKSNQATGILVAGVTLTLFKNGLILLEFSDANRSLINMLVFVAFLVFLANEHVFQRRKLDKERIKLANEKKMALASASTGK